MTTYMPFDREQAFLLPPDVKDWLPADDIAHFVVAAVERVRLGAFPTNTRPSVKPQYHPRLMLALLVYSYANGVFSSRRIERATYRDVGTRFIAANTHPDHDTIASFRRTNKQAFEAAFLQVLLLAREMGLLRLGTVSVQPAPTQAGGTKIDANASKIRSLRGACPRAGPVGPGAGVAGQARGRHRRADRQGRGGRYRGDQPAGAARGDRPPPEPKPERRITEPWRRRAMKAKLESEGGKARYKKRKQTVEPVFGIIKSAIGFTRFHLRARKKSPPSGC